MGERNIDALALLVKAESSYATDPTPTGGANAMIAKNVVIEPLNNTKIRRGILRPYKGHQGLILAGHWSKISFDVEIAGAGAAGDVPAWGVLHRMAGMSETVTEDTDVQYKPISSGYESGTIHYFDDGVRHVLLGARGNLLVGDLAGLSLPHWRYEMWGLAGTITDQAMPTEDLDAFVTPLSLGDGNTTLSVHGVSMPAERLSFNRGNQVETRFLLNQKSIKIVDHEVTGSVVLQADTLATKDWFAIAKAHTTGAVAFQHGTVAGNIVKIDGARVQVDSPSYGATQKIRNTTLPLIFQPTTGGDDFVITVK